MIRQEVHPDTGTLYIQIKLTEAELRRMTTEQHEMLADAGMLIQHALRGDTEPVYLRSLGCMSHEPASSRENR